MVDIYTVAAEYLRTRPMRAVMYHYVRPDLDRPPGGYYRLDYDDFRSQLDHLEREYDVLGRNRLLAVVRGGRCGFCSFWTLQERDSVFFSQLYVIF